MARFDISAKLRDESMFKSMQEVIFSMGTAAVSTKIVDVLLMMKFGHVVCIL